MAAKPRPGAAMDGLLIENHLHPPLEPWTQPLLHWTGVELWLPSTLGTTSTGTTYTGMEHPVHLRNKMYSVYMY